MSAARSSADAPTFRVVGYSTRDQPSHLGKSAHGLLMHRRESTRRRERRGQHGDALTTARLGRVDQVVRHASSKHTASSRAPRFSAHPSQERRTGQARTAHQNFAFCPASPGQSQVPPQLPSPRPRVSPTADRVTLRDRHWSTAGAQDPPTWAPAPVSRHRVRAAPRRRFCAACCGRRVSRIRHLRGGRTIATITVALPRCTRSKRCPATSCVRDGEQ